MASCSAMVPWPWWRQSRYLCVTPGSWKKPGQNTLCSASVAPIASPARPMNGLMVEPGGYWPRSARLYKGLSGIGLQGFVGGAVDAVDERLGVVARRADQRQHAAGIGVDRHQGAVIVAERRFSDHLQTKIDCN